MSSAERPESTSWSERAREVLDRALDLSVEERRRFVEEQLSAGSERDEVLGLLEHVESIDGFLDEPLASAAIEAHAVPSRIGGYQIERVLGFGSMGVVYLARQADPERTVAVKVLRIDCVGNAAVDRFRREVRLLGGLTHPGIATVYEAGVDDLGAGPQPWYAMEYVDGESLCSHADQNDLDRRGRVALIVQVAKAVQYAHEAGIVHRDLKPENVLVRQDGTVCVLDFGVAAIRNVNETFLTLTATGQIVGTLAYMAPEQARGAGLDARADQYALAAMLYELLTGELPLPVRGRLAHEALRVIADGTWVPPTRHDTSLAGDLEAILASALAPEPNRRYASVRDLGDDLGRWLAGKPVHARPPSAFDGAFRAAKRHKKLLALMAATLAVLGAVSALALRAVFERESEGHVALLFSDRELLDSLIREADELWPTSSWVVPQFDAWLARAHELQDRLDDHRSTRVELQQRSRATAAGVAHGNAWVAVQVDQLVSAIEHFTAPDGLLAVLEERRSQAAHVWARTVEDYHDAWSAAAHRVRSDERFEAFELPPQEGLVPLGPDPSSGLEEFALFGSGRIPARQAPDGLLRPDVGDALVLVLIPGGRRRIGTQCEDPNQPNFCALGWGPDPHETSTFSVRLDPFLIAKYECSQDQWFRWTAFNPSDWEVGSEFFGQAIGPLNPVESLSWDQAQQWLPRLGLELPTEAQWEVAARGGSPWARVHGPTDRDLAGFVSANTHQVDHPCFDPEFPDDGVRTHMRIGSQRPNGYGLHDVLGNVWELCQDTYKVDYNDLSHRDGDGLVIAAPDGDVSRRGGSADFPPLQLSVYRRQTKRFDGRDSLTGLRPARRLTGVARFEDWCPNSFDPHVSSSTR